MKKRLTIFASCFLVLALILTGCGAATKEEASIGSSFNGIDKGDMFDGFYGSADMEMAPEAPMEPSAKPESGNTTTNTSEQEQIKSQDKLVYTCNMTIETLQYKDTMKAIKDKITEFNGIIEYEEERDDSYGWYYEDYIKRNGTLHTYITIRIPSERYNEFLIALEGHGKVTNKSMNVENISKTYYETEATIESLKIQEERLLEMLKQADTIEDMITVETRLTEVQTQLNKYKTLLESMNMDVNYSTINLKIDEVLEYTATENPVKKNTFFDRLKNTIVDSWEFFLESLEDLLFFAIRLVPVAVIVGAIGIPVFLIVKTNIKKKKATKQPPVKPDDKK